MADLFWRVHLIFPCLSDRLSKLNPPTHLTVLLSRIFFFLHGRDQAERKKGEEEERRRGCWSEVISLLHAHMDGG